MILSGWEAVFFWVFSIAAIFAGLLTVMARNTIHSALFLISSLVSVGALEQLAEIKTIAARAASDRSVLVMPSLRVW